MLLQIQPKSSQNKFLAFVTENTTSQIVKTIDIYIKNDELFETENINNFIYLSYLDKKKKLPKFWSFKDGKFVYKIGLFTFDKQRFIQDLENIVAEFTS